MPCFGRLKIYFLQIGRKKEFAVSLANYLKVLQELKDIKEWFPCACTSLDTYLVTFTVLSHFYTLIISKAAHM